MGDVHTLHVELTQEDYLAANLTHARWQRLIWVVGLPMIAVGSILIVAFYQNQRIDWDDVATFAIVVSILAVWVGAFRFWAIPRSTRRIFTQQKSLQRPHEISWDQNQLVVENPNATSRTPWSDFLMWKENRVLFILYFSDVMFRIIPKRTFCSESAIADFRSLLQKKISWNAGRKRPQ